LSLAELLRARARAADIGGPAKDTSVVWLWLGGGATHIETFDPKMEAPSEYRSMVGAVNTSLPGVQIGGLLPEIAKRMHHMALVRSFAHGNSGHAGATHYVMTGTDHPPADSGVPPIRPSFGSITSKVRGTHNPTTGMPTYVRLDGLFADGPNFLGMANAPFDVGGQARQNMNLAISLDRLSDRRHLLDALDVVDRARDCSGTMSALDSFDVQAFDLIVGRSKEAFDLDREDSRVRAQYQAVGHPIGERLLLARRLCQAGCGFVTVHYANSSQSWDMHNKMLPQLEQACPPFDRAIATFLDDIHQLGLAEKILLVITGEFGRTPRINGDAGRDHWGPLCTLALAGGGLRMGQVVGESTSKAEEPKSAPITPRDVMATVFHVLGIDPNTQVTDPAGRPQFLLPPGARPIAELVGSQKHGPV
jgi:hypothetical protein